MICAANKYIVQSTEYVGASCTLLCTPNSELRTKVTERSDRG